MLTDLEKLIPRKSTGVSKGEGVEWGEVALSQDQRSGIDSDKCFHYRC